MRNRVVLKSVLRNLIIHKQIHYSMIETFFDKIVFNYAVEPFVLVVLFGLINQNYIFLFMLDKIHFYCTITTP